MRQHLSLCVMQGTFLITSNTGKNKNILTRNLI